MASYDSYYKQAINSSAETRAADIAAAEQVYDTQAQTVTDTYKTQMADTEISYENAFKSNEVQRQLNERYIARKAAELGLTDSGMNRTQQTAVQLSYANQKGSLSAQKQKAIDTLAQAMQAKIVEIQNNKTAAVQEINSSYDADARQQATSMYNSYQSSQANDATEDDIELDAFTGSTYDDAVAYMKKHGVPNGYASGMMTLTEWSRRRASYLTTGIGGSEVKNYSSYKEYITDFVEYQIENNSR